MQTHNSAQPQGGEQRPEVGHSPGEARGARRWGPREARGAQGGAQPQGREGRPEAGHSPREARGARRRGPREVRGTRRWGTAPGRRGAPGGGASSFLHLGEMALFSWYGCRALPGLQEVKQTSACPALFSVAGRGAGGHGGGFPNPVQARALPGEQLASPPPQGSSEPAVSVVSRGALLGGGPRWPVGAQASGGTGPPCLWELGLQGEQGSLACGSPAFRGNRPDLPPLLICSHVWAGFFQAKILRLKKVQKPCSRFSKMAVHSLR